MKILSKPEKLVEIASPFVNRIYRCPICGTQFLIELEDAKDIFSKSIMDVDAYWYEHNMPRDMRIHYINCGYCNEEVALETWSRGIYSYDGTKELGGAAYVEK